MSKDLLSQAEEFYQQTGVKQRLFMSKWYQADSWDRERFVIIKAEAHEKGTNRRAIVTNRPGAMLLIEATYDEYTERGESENRNKELKRGMKADRLSDHRFLANFFRLYLHVTALNLLGPIATHGDSRSVAGIFGDPRTGSSRSPLREAPQRVLQPSSSGRSPGRRRPRHLAIAVHQSGC